MQTEEYGSWTCRFHSRHKPQSGWYPTIRAQLLAVTLHPFRIWWPQLELIVSSFNSWVVHSCKQVPVQQTFKASHLICHTFIPLFRTLLN